MASVRRPVVSRLGNRGGIEMNFPEAKPADSFDFKNIIYTKEATAPAPKAATAVSRNPRRVIFCIDAPPEIYSASVRSCQMVTDFCPSRSPACPSQTAKAMRTLSPGRKAMSPEPEAAKGRTNTTRQPPSFQTPLP